MVTHGPNEKEPPSTGARIIQSSYADKVQKEQAEQGKPIADLIKNVNKELVELKNKTNSTIGKITNFFKKEINKDKLTALESALSCLESLKGPRSKLDLTEDKKENVRGTLERLQSSLKKFDAKDPVAILLNKTIAESKECLNSLKESPRPE